MNFLNKKIMIPFKKVTFVLMMTVLVVGCDDFGNLNIDSNNPSQVKTDLLLTNAQRTVNSVVGAVTGTLYVQYFAETQYNEDSRYESETFDFNGWYTGALMDLQTIINLNTDPATKDNVLSGGSNVNQIAVARIMKAYYYQLMTDRWGALPYTQALKGREIISPAYDSQEAIYMDLVKELKEAAAQIDVNSNAVNGDILFQGDMGTWKKFANSIRARLALRMADVNATVAKAEFVDAYNKGLIDEDLMYPYLGEASNENPWFSRYRTRTDYAISDVMADYMKGLNDYRVTKYADPASGVDNKDGITTFNEVQGLDYDIENPGDILNSAVSFPGMAIRAQSAPLPIITVTEMNFAIAEAIERKWIAGSAATFYMDAIEASWKQWDVYELANFTAYITNPEVVYNSANWKEKIGKQKWVALFPQGYEAWSEWRRIGWPKLTPHAFAMNASKQIPVRHAYPTSESQINKVNYEAAVKAQGPDDGTTKLWWDVN